MSDMNVFSSCHTDEVYDEYDIDVSTLELLRHVLFYTLKVYWLPRYLIGCCSASSRRKQCLGNFNSI